MKKILLVLITICISQLGCSGSSNNSQSSINTQPITATKVFLVEHQLVDCEGVAIMKCMVVNGEYFYDTIEGFVYEEGYHYTLEVEETYISEDEIPADGSLTSYRLLKQVSKVAVN